MPIYEYECPKCGVFEVTQKIKEGPLRRCPTCKAKVERIISATSFVLKGSGWYATDYAKPGSAPKTENSSDTSGSNTTPSSTESSGKTNGTAAPSEAASKPATEKPAAEKSTSKPSH
jgi:putative FmdB family regulatory protein